MTTPQDLINGALRSIGALESGEQPDPDASADALGMLNDMLAQWSNERMLVFFTTEIVFPLTNTQSYTIGPGGTMAAQMTGSVAQRVATITALASGSITLGMQLSGTNIAAGSQIVAFGTGAGGSGAAALGTYILSTASTAASTAIAGTYQRPLRINSAFVRVATLDHPVAVPTSIEDFELIGLKSLSGPWPRCAYYQPSMPLGNITFWPVPSVGNEIHLFVDTVLNQFQTLQDTVQLPQGYNLALRFGLAELLMPEYGRVGHDSAQWIMTQAAKGRAFLKRTNMAPQPKSHFHPILAGRTRAADASWILSGGYR